MTDYTLATDEEGIYEMTLTANTPMTVALDSPSVMTLMTHTGTAPVYVRTGPAVVPRDRRATCVPVGTYADVPGSSDLFSFSSDSDATVSIMRSR
jgi:hypothetical protein